MRRTLTCLPLCWCLLLCSLTFAQLNPTTTLAAETGNNTSAADSFTSQSDGNLGAGNISKVDIHSLLYPGATTRIYAHLVPWFGGSNHMDVGYSSTDPAQVHRQIEDMISRGLDGVIIDWYGPGTPEDIATGLVMAEAERHPGFSFAVMVDKGAIPHAGCGSCSAQQALIDELNYIARTYYGSSAYMRWKDRPMVTNFDLDLHYSIDWNAVRSAVAGNPAFIFQHAGGFTHPQTSGSYSWVILSSDYGMSYLSNFYNAGLANPSEDAYGAAYKGFNDSLASWGTGRVMSQQCGQTWLQTFSKINHLYDSSRQLDALQLVTWNDYEEGTEIESGIDNCVSISASVSGETLQWAVHGSENTIDHYRVFVSADGNNLMELSQVGAGNHSLNVGSYSLAAGNYTLYVQAVGKPVFRNHMSGAVHYTATGSGGASASAGIALGATPSTLNLSRGQSANVQVSVTATGGKVNTVALSCSNLPAGTNCTFSPNSVSPGSGTATATLTLAAGQMTAAVGRPLGAGYALWLPLFGFAGIFALDAGKLRQRALAVMALALLVLACSCGGGTSAAPSNASQTATQGTYAVVVSGTTASGQTSTTLTLKIQ